MASSGNEDQDQRNINGVEDPKTTIEFLRGRLLAERSVSRTARQRADELARRVLELEEQLKFVSLQRKKAEKATAAVLSILENHGVTDASEDFNSESDGETILSDSKDAENNTEGRDTSSSVKERENDLDAFSSSEIGSSSSTGRSLSWKCGKGSLRSVDRRKYTDSNRRRCKSSTSAGISSPIRAGKSCRRIRSASDELQNSSVECASKALPSSANSCPQFMMDSAGNRDANDQVHVSASGVSKNGRQADKSDEDMQRALHRKAQLIGQYEDEEKAQREWEEKYRESTSYTPDSCDLGNHSDVTEERDESKASQQPCLDGRTTMQNHANKYKAVDVPSTENGIINNSQSFPHVDMGCLKDEKSRTVKSDSPASEFARPVSNENYLENHSQTSDHCRDQSFPVTHSHGQPRGHTTSCSEGSSLQVGQADELALVSHNTSDGVGSVLGALEQAKLSLSKQINRSPPLRAESSMMAIERSIPATRINDRTESPAGCPALFRMPQLEAATTGSYPESGSRFSSANYFPENSANKFSTSPYMDYRSNAVTLNRFSSLSPGPSLEVTSPAVSYSPICETTFDAGLPSSVRFNPYSSSRPPLSGNFMYPTYPLCPNVVPKLSSGEAFSRNHPSHGTGIPPSFSFSTLCPDVVPKLPSGEMFSRNLPGHEAGLPPSGEVFSRNLPPNIPPSFSVSRYDTHIRPNMYSTPVDNDAHIVRPNMYSS